MDPFGVKDAVELANSPSETGKTIKAFENNKLEVKPPRHITTINEHLSGQTYPGTDVGYHKHTFVLNGERVEGTFPKFPSRFDTMLPWELRMSSDEVQFKYCTQRLAKAIEANPALASNFTPRQLEQIKNRDARIGGLTWHHNEIPGRMQLVDAQLHDTCRHTGGKSLWGGGKEYR